MEIITSKQNKNILLAKKLQNKKYRKEFNLCCLEGEKLIKEALSANLNFKMVFVLKDKEFDILNSLNCEIFSIDRQLLKLISCNVSPQGIIAIVDTRYQIIAKNKRFLVLDGIQNPDNLGAIVRTAVATGFNTIYTINCVDLFNEKVLRASMGNVFKVNFIDINYQQLVELNKLNDIYFADMHGGDIFKIASFKENVGIVIGNEGNGVSDNVKEIVKNSLSIPMLNNVESLNASVSAGVIMYSVFSKLKD